MLFTARVGHVVNNNCEYHDDRGSNKRCFCGLFALNTEPKIDDDGTRDAVDAIVAVVPEPDRSTAACHAAAVFNRHDDSPDARPSLGALDDVHTDAVERRQTATNYLYGKD